MTTMIPGLVHLYIGDGKGKTTAAIGLAVRALGAGRRVLIAQFLKGRDTSELEPLRRLGIDVIRTDEIQKFTFSMNGEELAAAREDCVGCLEQVAESMAQQRYDVVVLDEVVDAVNAGLLDPEALLALIQGRAEQVEVVMTGRNPGDSIVEAADYVTVMTALKHPYRRGVLSRRGIEY